MFQNKYFIVQGDTPLDVCVSKRGTWIASRIRTTRSARGLDGGGLLKRLSNDKVRH